MPPNLHHPDHWSPQTLNLAEHDADALFPVPVQLGVQRVLGDPEVLELPGAVQVEGVLGLAEALLLELVANQAHQGVVLATPVD